MATGIHKGDVRKCGWVVGCVSRRALKCAVFMPALQCRERMSYHDAVHQCTIKRTQERNVSKANIGRGVERVGDSGDSKKLQVFRQHASGVSRALWPADMRHNLATSRVAQQRRKLVIRENWWAKLLATIQTSTTLTMGAITLCVGGSMLVTLLFHAWWLLLFPITILTLLSLAIMPPLLVKLKQRPRMSVAQHARELRNTPGISAAPSMRRSPETPIPKTPLVRELETFDLSQTGVEHFLESSAERNTAGHRFHLEEDTSDKMSQL